jgi:hypothetical protein
MRPHFSHFIPFHQREYHAENWVLRALFEELKLAIEIIIAHPSLAPLDLIDKGVVEGRDSDFFTLVHFLITPKGEKQKKKDRELAPPV